MYRLGQSLHACKQISLTSLLFLNHEGFFFFFFWFSIVFFPSMQAKKKHRLCICKPHHALQYLRYAKSIKAKHGIPMTKLNYEQSY